jgi:predicted nucleic acid-binding protein
MILYLDSSALVKCYIDERGTSDVLDAMGRAELVGTCFVTRAEVSAGLAKATRLGVVTEDIGRASLDTFRKEWTSLVRVEVTASLVAQADELAWRNHLRGYDAVHLAAALVWRGVVRAQVTLATFDRQLWLAAQSAGLALFPEDLQLAK